MWPELGVTGPGQPSWKSRNGRPHAPRLGGLRSALPAGGTPGTPPTGMCFTDTDTLKEQPGPQSEEWTEGADDRDRGTQEVRRR